MTYVGHTRDLGKTRGWLKSTCEERTEALTSNSGPLDRFAISIESWDQNTGTRSLIRVTADEAFEFALGILRDVSLARFGAG